MAENKEPRDEKLIEELYERLWWYTYEASEEEFDEKEVDAITRLLDVLEPVHDDQAFEPGADAALKRFWERYGEEEENASVSSEADTSASGDASAEEDDAEHRELHAEEMPAAETSAAETAKTVKTSAKPGRGSKWRKRLIRIAIGTAACVVLLISVNVGSYALRKKSFFEIVREEVGRTEITVTGNTEEFEENAEGIFDKESNAIGCSSWEEVEEIVGEEVLQPSYMPKDYELTRITIQVLETKQVVTAKYNNKNGKYFRFKIDIYKEKYREDVVQYNSEWKYLGEDESKYKAQYYCKDEIIESFFSQGKNIYYILSNENIDIIKDVIEQIG